MSKLTLGRMAKLYKMHRSSLYEAVAKGRVSAGFDGKGQRVVDLAEMIRVYGEPPGRPTPQPDTQTAPPDTRPTPEHWAEMLAELRLLRQEVADLRKDMRLLEHKPQDRLESQPIPKPPMEEVKAPKPNKTTPPRTFADILESLN